MSKKQNVIIVQTILALAAVEALVLVSAVYARDLLLHPSAGLPKITAAQLLVAFLLSTTILLILIRALRRRRFVFEAIFAISVFLGIWALFEVFIPTYAIFIALFLTALRYALPAVLTHNLVMLTGIAGIGLVIGIATPWTSMMIVLGFLALYDVIAVYGTKHMVTMFKSLADKGVIFAIIVPEKTEWLFKRLAEIKPGKGFFFLGSGDIAIPALFVASAVREGLIFGVGAALGALVGLFFTDILFSWGRRRPMPALPPIALGTILGFFAVMLV